MLTHAYPMLTRAKVPLVKLTIRTIAAITPNTDRDLVVWDSDLAGFGLRMKPSGVASFMVQYRNQEGVSRRVTIGKVGVLAPEEARKLAREKLAEVAKGGDPSADRHSARSAPTVSDICEWYLAQAEAGQLLGRHDAPIKRSTLYQDRSRIRVNVLPLLGSRKVNGLKPDDIRDFVNAIKSGRTAKERSGRGGEAKGGAGAAARCVGMLRTIFNHAMREHPDRKFIKSNPCDAVKKPADGKQRRYLTVDEIAKLGEAMRAATEAGDAPTGVGCIRFLLLTGLRRMEALSLPWEWIDSKSRCIRFADTKSGAQLRPIGADAVKLLDCTPKRNDCPWVFPADRGTSHYIGLPKVLGRLCKHAGLEGVTVHVLRHSFAATAAEMDYSELTIAGLLGHGVASVTGRYAHVPDRALVFAADAVAARIAAALDGKGEADIVDISERRKGIVQ